MDAADAADVDELEDLADEIATLSAHIHAATMVRAWKKGNRSDEATWAREQYEARTFSVVPDDDGMYVVRGRLTPEIGALLMRAIDAAGDALFRERRLRNDISAIDTDMDAAQRRADAVGLLAERALAAGFGGKAVASSAPAVQSADSECACASPDVPISGTRAERYQVILHVEPATLRSDAEPGRAELEDGTRVSAETCRRLSCDASIINMTHADDGSILEIGRKARTISNGLRRALEVRDRGCRFPGCHLRFTDAHHLMHWADGGETGLSNCLLLCPFHHRLVHEGGWRVGWWGRGRPVFYDPRGAEHFDGRWQPPCLSASAVADLIRDNERRGVTPDASTAGVRWERERDIPDRVYFRALEAL